MSYDVKYIHTTTCDGCQMQATETTSKARNLPPPGWVNVGPDVHVCSEACAAAVAMEDYRAVVARDTVTA